MTAPDHARQGADAVLYIEAGQLLDYLRRHTSLTGIQRLSLACAKRLPLQLGAGRVSLLAYDARSRAYVTAPASHFNTQHFLQRDHLNIRSPMWKKAELSPADTVLLTETWWWPAGIGDAAAKLQAQTGARIFRFVHDVIPLITPHYVGVNIPEQFRRGLLQAAASSDVLLTNSQSSGRDLQQALALAGVAAPPIRVVPLAHEFEAQNHFAPLAPAWHPASLLRRFAKRRLTALLERMRAHPHVLCVGTIEARKNVLRLLHAWSALGRKHGDTMPRLILAGRWGWNFSEIRAFLRATGHLGGKVELLLGFDDEALKALYEHCLFTVYLSHYEGWGLPVGESMWLAKPVLASHSSSIPEVGGELVDYVDPGDQSAIAAAIEKLAFDKAHREGRIAALKSAKLRNWDDFTRDMVAAMNLAPLPRKHGKTA